MTESADSFLVIKVRKYTERIIKSLFCLNLIQIAEEFGSIKNDNSQIEIILFLMLRYIIT